MENVNTIITKTHYISKTKSRTKNTIIVKNIVWSIRIFPVKLATSEENLIFCTSFWTFWTAKTHKLKIGKIWDIIFHSFLHIAHLLCKDGHFWRGEVGGVCITLLVIGPSGLNIIAHAYRVFAKKLVDLKMLYFFIYYC